MASGLGEVVQAPDAGTALADTWALAGTAKAQVPVTSNKLSDSLSIIGVSLSLSRVDLAG